MVCNEAATVEAIELVSFEEKVAALAVVTEVAGEEHPLVQTLHDSLTDEADIIEFEGEDASEIVRSLELVAGGSTVSNYQPTAKRMLQSMLNPEQEANNSGQGKDATESVSVTAKLPTQPIQGVLLGDRVVLRNFEHRITAFRSVEAFAGKVARENLIAMIGRDIESSDPLTASDTLYLGNSGNIIYHCLRQAAERRHTTYDIHAEAIIAADHGDDTQLGTLPAEADEAA